MLPMKFWVTLGFSFIFYNANCQAKEDSVILKLDEVTVVGTRFEQADRSLAQQVQSVSKSTINRLNQPTTAELLMQSGLCFIQKSQMGGGSPVLRGFEANKILIVVDGIRLNNSIFRGGHLQNIITIDQAALQKAEILFGPSSLMYGSDALGGVISLSTKKLSLGNSSKALIANQTGFARYSSAYNEKTVHADVSLLSKKIASYSGFTITHFGDLRQGSRYYKKYPDWGKRNFYVNHINGVDSVVLNNDSEKQVPTNYAQYDFIQKLLFKTGKTEHTLNAQYSTSSDIYRYDRLTEISGNGLPRSAQWYYGPQERLLLAWNLQFSPTLYFDKSQITAAYQLQKESRHNRNFGSKSLNHRSEKVDMVTLNADFYKSFNRLSVNYGAEIVYNKVISTADKENIQTGELSKLDTRYPDGGSNTQAYALYVLGNFPITKNLSIGGGLRATKNRLYSKFDDKLFFPFPFNDVTQKNNAISGKFELVYHPDEHTKIIASYSTGFRTPNVDDMSKVFESGNGNLIIPNPFLKPEKTKNIELGLKHLFKHKVLLSYSMYYTQLSNLLTTVYADFNGSDSIIYDGTPSRVTTVSNKDKAFIFGFQANLDAKLNKYFSFTSSIAYNKGRIKEPGNDYPLDHIPPIYGRAACSFQKQHFYTEFYLLFNAAKKAKDYNLRGEDNQKYSADMVNGFTPAWQTFNIRTEYIFNKSLSIQLAVENIFDKFYRPFASGISGAGRNISTTVRVQF